MTDRVRTVRSGILGLDLALGGGPRLLRRTHAEDRESAALVIRGGPGAGKSVLAQDLALRLADALSGDVLYACVEVLPSEILAQRQGFHGFDASKAVDLSEQAVKPEAAVGPCLAIGMREIPTGVDGEPDLGQALLDLARIAARRGFVSKVVVVDSLSEGYQLGHTSPRELVDGVCKLAIEQGWVLILIEEATSEAAVSPWCFAVDTVLSLRLSERGGSAHRELTVSKHRFAACEPGPHEVIIEYERIRVIPPLLAYRHAVNVINLPRPANGRSMRIIVNPPEPKWDRFAIPDGQGRCILFEEEDDDSQTRFASVLSFLLGTNIGKLSNDGSAHPGSWISFSLVEKMRPLFNSDETGFNIPMMHPLIGGAEWLEDALTRLAGWRSDVARIRIGPTDALGGYQHEEDLRRAIFLFVVLLVKKGFLVVLSGLCGENSPSAIIKSLIPCNQWKLLAPDESGSRFLDISFGAENKITVKPDFEILD